MQRGEARNHVFHRLGWAPTQSIETVDTFNGFVERAHQQLAIDFPLVFWEVEDMHIETQEDILGAAAVATDRLTVVPSDAFVLYRPSAPVGGATWVFDGSWDGRWLYVQEPTGDIRRLVQTREFWRQTLGIGEPWLPPGTYDFVTLREPWHDVTHADMNYRVLTPQYPLEANVINILACRVRQVGNDIEVVQHGEIDRIWDFDTDQSSYQGVPERLYRGRHFQLDAPNAPPTVALAPDVAWGPDPAGTFDYYSTWCWGRRGIRERSPQNIRAPLWESAPSPISATATSTFGGAGPSIDISVPNPDWMEGFGTATDPRFRRSGLYARIYGRRRTATGGAVLVEAPTIPYLLGELDGITEATPWTLRHNGVRLLDRHVRLQDTHGHHSIRFWPRPGLRYDIDLRVLRRPPALDNDSDAPQIHEEGIEPLIQLTLAYAWEHLHNTAEAMLARREYQKALDGLRAISQHKRERITRRLPGHDVTDPRAKLPIWARGTPQV